MKIAEILFKKKDQSINKSIKGTILLLKFDNSSSGYGV